METRELIEELRQVRDYLRGNAEATKYGDRLGDSMEGFIHKANMVGEAMRRMEKGAEMVEKARFYDAIRNDEGGE